MLKVPACVTAASRGARWEKGGEIATCVSSAAWFQGKFALSQLLKRNVSECQMPGATYALHKRGSINHGAVSGKKSGSKEESSGIQFFFFLKLGQQCFSLLCGPAVKEFITLSLPLFFFFFFIQEESESMCVCVCVCIRV